MENNKIKLSLSTVLLIIAAIAIVIMAFIIFSLTENKAKTDNEIQKLKNENQSIQNKLDSMQGTLNNMVTNTVPETSAKKTSDTVSKTEKEQVEEVAIAFVNAVNSKDWAIAQKYSSSYNIIEELKKYNVTNVSIDLTTLDKNPNHLDNYYCFVDYSINYQGSTDIKDFSLGRLFCIDKINGSYKVSSFGATGY